MEGTIMQHPLVSQLRFTRSEFMRAVKGVNDEDARKRILPMNCISWNVGHLAWQEQRYFLGFGQGKILFPQIERDFAYGAPASIPPLKDALSAWKEITAAADPWLDLLTTAKLQKHPVVNGKSIARIYIWQPAPAGHLSLLVSYRGESSDPSAIRPHPPAAICRCD
jgi:hypothetical protein